MIVLFADVMIVLITLAAILAITGVFVWWVCSELWARRP